MLLLLESCISNSELYSFRWPTMFDLLAIMVPVCQMCIVHVCKSCPAAQTDLRNLTESSSHQGLSSTKYRSGSSEDFSRLTSKIMSVFVLHTPLLGKSFITLAF